MKYHLDTSFLIDWQRDDPRIRILRDEILAGEHEVSIDPIVHTEFMAARVVPMRKIAVMQGVLAIGRWLPISIEASRLAAVWLGSMDPIQRRAHFNDALVAATASIDGSTLLTGDSIAAGLFPVATELYK